MIEIQHPCVHGFEAAIRGMRNPKNSWEKSDSQFGNGYSVLGPNDLKLANALAQGTDDHSKFLRMITVTCDITAPLYWWKEMDTYKVGTVADSCSTMHKIAEKRFTRDDFSHEHLIAEPFTVPDDHQDFSCSSFDGLDMTIAIMNHYRDKFLCTKDKRYWWQMIQLLPSSYNQRRTWMADYQVLKRIYFARKDHKLDEWRQFCKWIEGLPYASVLMLRGPFEISTDGVSDGC